MPSTNSTLKVIAGAGNVYNGSTKIVLGTAPGKMTVTNNGVTTERTYPANGVIYVQNSGSCPTYRPMDIAYGGTDTSQCGDALVSGTYDTSLTIATENDVIANGDILRNTNADVMLGLIANGFVRVRHDVNWKGGADCDNSSGGFVNREIDAAILTLQHSFMVDGYYCGNPLGTLTINGGIAQKFRGPVGKGGATPSNGYIKNYKYDRRLQFRAPPHFLDPVQSAWRVWRYTEQQPGIQGG
jgi:hypothetical protein